MNIAVGIVTHNRPQQLRRLLAALLSSAAGFRPTVIVAENGSDTVPGLLQACGWSGSVTYISLPRAGIPQARNAIFRRVKRSYDLLIFIDDDCLPSPDWLPEIEKLFRKHRSIQVLQGGVRSTPAQNIFAQTTGLLYDLWVNGNRSTHGILRILDTKNISFRLNAIRHRQRLFDESLSYASDIDLAVRFEREGLPVHYAPTAWVFHQERSTLRSFISHRFRQSWAFRHVAQRYPGYFRSAAQLPKFFFLWHHLHQPAYRKILLFMLLGGIYAAVALRQFTEQLLHPLGKMSARVVRGHGPSLP